MFCNDVVGFENKCTGRVELSTKVPIDNGHHLRSRWLPPTKTRSRQNPSVGPGSRCEVGTQVPGTAATTPREAVTASNPVFSQHSPL